MSPMPAEAVLDVLPPETKPDAGGFGRERCDRCGVRAYVTTMHGDGLQLTWCKHHFEVYAPGFAADPGVAVVVDERARLNATRPTHT